VKRGALGNRDVTIRN